MVLNHETLKPVVKCYVLFTPGHLRTFSGQPRPEAAAACGGSRGSSSSRGGACAAADPLHTPTQGVL